MEEALPRTAGPPGPRLRLLLLPPDSRSWFISKSQLATSWTFARLSEEEKGLAFYKETQKKDKIIDNDQIIVLAFLILACVPEAKIKVLLKRKNKT